MDKKNLWILTEERPKREVITKILYKFAKDHKIACFIGIIMILPILNEDRRFTFLYEVVGFHSNKINKVFLKIVSGYSSFVDFLIFYQDKEPTEDDSPLYAIEETKTDDSESRNTGVFQRASKFVYIDYYYPNIRKIMLYNLKIQQKDTPTYTYIFGTRCLLTLGVEILGKKLDKIFTPFSSVDDLINFKNAMRKPPRGNVPILIHKQDNVIKISGRLIKSNSLSHDPNIGALSLISATLRKLGWEGSIIITNHGLNQDHLNPHNKFIKIAKMLNIEVDGLNIPTNIKRDKRYWKYETESEKLGTIFIHIVVENFTNGGAIFENHAGCEKGYFITKDGKPIPLEKYSDREAYKGGDTSKIISIPDLILIDFGRCEIINIEGKKYEFRHKAIEELNNFDEIEKRYIKKYYSEYKIIRTVVLYGGQETKLIEIEIGFLLNKSGDLVLGIKPPELFKDAIKNLIDFWFC